MNKKYFAAIIVTFLLFVLYWVGFVGEVLAVSAILTVSNVGLPYVFTVAFMMWIQAAVVFDIVRIWITKKLDELITNNP